MNQTTHISPWQQQEFVARGLYLFHHHLHFFLPTSKQLLKNLILRPRFIGMYSESSSTDILIQLLLILFPFPLMLDIIVNNMHALWKFHNVAPIIMKKTIHLIATIAYYAFSQCITSNLNTNSNTFSNF